MYGYIRPVKAELKVREYEAFRSAYCGLCEALKKEYGPLARFAVNYDLTFLPMLLGCTFDGRKKRCIAHPFRKRLCIGCDPHMKAAADFTIILAWWKLRDNYRDAGGIGILPAGLLSLLLTPAYRKAARRQKAFAERTEECLRELSRLETEKSDSLDRTADCFARILSGTVSGEDGASRIARETLYHVGRCIYLMDALDDFEEDVRQGSYNPLRCRFQTDELTVEQKKEVQTQINLSQHRAAASLALRSSDLWTPILENIVFLGIPGTVERILSGKKQTKKMRE